VIYRVHCTQLVAVSSDGFESPDENGAGDRDRTGDIQLGKLAFYR
jgi:hypothetical protein